MYTYSLNILLFSCLPWKITALVYTSNMLDNLYRKNILQFYVKAFVNMKVHSVITAQTILLAKTTAARNEVSLIYHRVRGVYFLAVVFAATVHNIISYVTETFRLYISFCWIEIQGTCVLFETIHHTWHRYHTSCLYVSKPTWHVLLGVPR